MAKIKDIIEYFDRILPESLSEPWDNDGVMVNTNDEASIKRVIVALDATSAVIKKAIEISAELIVTHHPLIFSPLTRLVGSDAYGKRLMECVKSDISVLSYHTRLDEVEGGVCDCLSQKIGLFDTQKMEPCGRIGFVNEEMSYDDFRRHVKNALGINSTSGVYCGKPVNKVAVVSGSGKEYITDAKKAGADTFLTGEMNHSSLIEAREIGLNVVCGTHYATENVVLQRLKVLLLEEFPDLEIEIMPFEAEREYGI